MRRTLTIIIYISILLISFFALENKFHFPLVAYLISVVGTLYIYFNFEKYVFDETIDKKTYLKNLIISDLVTGILISFMYIL